MNIRQSYINTIRGNCASPENAIKDVSYWRNYLFAGTIIFLLPLCLIALIPGIYWSLFTHNYVIAQVDITVLICLLTIAFVPLIGLNIRKLLFIACAYLLSFAMIYTVGLKGPELLYLLVACLFSILIFSSEFSLYPAIANTIICVAVALAIYYQQIPILKNVDDSFGTWIATSSNLIFLSFLIAVLIPQIFNGLQKSIKNEKILAQNVILSEQHLAEAQRLAKMGSWNFDFKKDILTWSNELYNVFDTDRKTFTESHGSFINLLDPLDEEFILSTSKNAQATGEPFDIEYTIITKMGERRIIHELGYGEKDEQGNVVRLFGTAQDITEWKKAAEQQLLLVSIINSTDDAILTKNLDGIITSWNYGAEKLFGYSAEEIIGKNNFTLSPPNRIHEENEIIAAIMEGQTIKHFETKRVKKDGTSIYVSLTISPIKDSKGNIVGFSIISRDITERKKLEVQKQTMLDEIVQRNKNLEQFSYIVSHNLRAPVANILGLTSNFQEKNLPFETSKYINAALHTSASQLDEVIKDLNNILKVKHNVIGIKELVNLSALVSNIQVDFEIIIKKKNATITWDFSELTEFMTIKSYLHSIFYNLISNSLKYHQPHVALLLEIKSQVINNKVILLFKDNGLGIDLEKQKNKIFGLYKRFHIKYAEGKGMGLYMVKTQVEALGGSISLKSEVNIGTEIRIEF